MHFFRPLLHWKVCSDCSSTDSPIRKSCSIWVSTVISSCPNRRIWRAKVQTKPTSVSKKSSLSYQQCQVWRHRLQITRLKIRPKMRYRKLKMVQIANYAKWPDWPVWPDKSFPPNRIQELWYENCQTCEIANLQFRSVSQWRSSVQEMLAHLKNTVSWITLYHKNSENNQVKQKAFAQVL